MEFDSALAIIAGWVGQNVAVDVMDLGSTADIASLRGKLGPPTEISEGATEDESLRFPLGEDGGCELALQRPAFREAQGDERYLELTVGGCRLTMSCLAADTTIRP